MTAEENAPTDPVLFLREKWRLVLLLSIAVLIPCFWHRHIEAGDLGSHVYNAWLAQLIAKGQAPGLYIVGQWDNVLVDLALVHTANLLGFVAAEKIVVSACVLVFFWGVFSFVSAVSGRAPWLLGPAIAMLAYGYALHMGFLNYYVSLGLACFGLALLWRCRTGAGHWLAFAALAFLTFSAHPIGFVWLVGTLAYRFSRQLLLGRFRLLAPIVVVSLLAGLHWFLGHRILFFVDWRKDWPAYFYNGADQLAVYGDRYVTLAWVALSFGAICVAVDLFRRDRKHAIWPAFGLPFELYAVTFCATWLLPENLRPSPTGGWIGLLASRLTVIAAIFGLCILGLLSPRKWHLAGFTAVAIVFFAFVYQDAAWLNRLEANAESALSRVPYGTRIIPTISPPDDWRVPFIGHLADRACIHRCFVYSNYEAPTGQFRIRVSRQGSPVVTTSNDDAEDMAGGAYEVQDSDPPLKQLYQCDQGDLTKLCLRDLAPGENTGTLVVQPPH